MEIRMEDRRTKSEAEKHLKNGTTRIEDLEENSDKHMEECKQLAENQKEYNNMVEDYKKMIRTKEPVADWGVVKADGETYYIQYVL